ncbi:MAG: helix-turn-helix domain-containing protein [Alsobacter sp.]
MTAENGAQELKKLPLFRQLEEVCFKTLYSDSTTSSYPQGVTLFWQGQDIRFLHILLSGHVSLEGYFDSKQYCYAFAEPGCMFPVGVFSGNRICLTTATTVSGCRIMRIPIALARSLFESSPTFAAAVARTLAVMLEKQIKLAHNRYLRSAPQRLAHFVLDLHERTPENLIPELPYDKQAIASLLGFSSATLGRAIEVLSSHGVQFERRQVAISDLSRLRDLANPTPHLSQLDRHKD